MHEMVTHPHLKQFIQLFAVDSSEISIYMNLKFAVDRHTNVNKSKGDINININEISININI